MRAPGSAPATGPRGGPRGGHLVRKRLEALRQAFAEFLWLPTSVIAAFLLLAVATFALDRGDVPALVPARAWLQGHAFTDAAATGELLTTIASGLITITSITVSLLLIALQQSASSLTHQVYDQFLRSWHNQAYFGFFVGVSVYALATLASVGPLNPVLGGSVALLCTILALCLLLILFYTTVNQMRPEVIIEAIHHHALAARTVQLGLVRKTRRSPSGVGSVSLEVNALAHGFVTRIDVDAISRAAARAGAPVEVVLQITLGAYIVFGQRLAQVNAHSMADASAIAGMLENAIHRADNRDIATDPLDAVEELETIGWTAISSARSDPDAGVLAIYSLRDILARWSVPQDDGAPGASAPVVYTDDVLPRLLNAFESLVVAAAESRQHQSVAEVLRTFELLFERLPPALQLPAEDLILRSLPTLSDHLLTHELESALSGLIAVLEAAGKAATAAAVRAARDQLAQAIGARGDSRHLISRRSAPDTAESRKSGPSPTPS